MELPIHLLGRRLGRVGELLTCRSSGSSEPHNNLPDLGEARTRVVLAEQVGIAVTGQEPMAVQLGYLRQRPEECAGRLPALFILADAVVVRAANVVRLQPTC